ncbi:cyclin-like protein [Pelagophyceae sp. CCMP2097]|nr:cyclin-like protein [Pelagophyceae sp. CCMP2097]
MAEAAVLAEAAALAEAVDSPRHTALLFHAGLRLRLPQAAVCAAISFFYRVAERPAAPARDEAEKREVACACLFLAGKVCEAPRKMRDVLNAMHHALHGSAAPVFALDEAYFLAKAGLVDAEQRALRDLGFDVAAPWPIDAVRAGALKLEFDGGLARHALSLLNDALWSPQCRHLPPPAVACAALLLTKAASTPLGADPAAALCASDARWREVLGDADRADVSRACSAILDVHERLNALANAGVPAHRRST